MIAAPINTERRYGILFQFFFYKIIGAASTAPAAPVPTPLSLEMDFPEKRNFWKSKFFVIFYRTYFKQKIVLWTYHIVLKLLY